jgi:hypothetical protein
MVPHAYRQAPNEYLATTHNLRRLDGTIAYASHSITARLDRPTTHLSTTCHFPQLAIEGKLPITNRMVK